MQPTRRKRVGVAGDISTVHACRKPYEHLLLIQLPIGVESFLVYCTKCGTKNEEDAKYCSKCGANLEVSREKIFERRAEEWGEEFGRRAEEWGEQFGKRAEKECFGLPHGGAIFGLFIGIIIILAGTILILQEKGVLVEGLDVLWPFFVIIFGILFVAGAIYTLTRR